MRRIRLFAALAALLAPAPDAAAQLRVVVFNVSNEDGAPLRAGMPAVLQGMGDESRNGVARPIDVLLLGESRSPATTGANYAAAMNALYGANAYAFGTVAGATTGNGTQSVVYRSASVQLVAESAVGTVSSAGAARQALRHQFRPVGYDGSGTAQATGTADFTVYNMHWKSATDSEARRNAEATAIRANADALPVAAGASRRVIYAGDFNLYSGAEDGYRTMLAAGAAQATDPLAAQFVGGDWTGAANRGLHTQSPVTATDANFPGQAGGGMDDRFDFQLVSAAAAVGQRGLSALANSSRVFGNNGTHAYNGRLSTGTGTLAATLEQVCDHLPVVVDYQLPARLAVASVAAPARALRDSTVSASFTVTNSAPVAVAVGADRLDYTFGGSAGLTGSGTGTNLAALATGNAHALAVNTATPSVVNGTVSVSATAAAARGVGNPAFSQAVSTTVLDNANPSFDAATAVTTRSVNLGSTPESVNLSQAYTLYNRASSFGAGFTSNLRILSAVEANPGGAITLGVTSTSDLSAGFGRGFTADLYSTTPGAYTDTFTFTVADENLPGFATYTLTFNVAGTVAPVPEPLGVLAVGALTLGLARRLRRHTQPAAPRRPTGVAR